MATTWKKAYKTISFESFESFESLIDYISFLSSAKKNWAFDVINT